MTRGANKTEDVLEHLKTIGWITSVSAIKCYGATRLSSIIFTLRKRGYDIETVTTGGVDRYGHAVNYAVYVYHPKKEDEDENLLDV